MRVLITGANGQLGTDLCKALKNADVIPLTHADIEITDVQSVKDTLNRHQPEVIINAAAFMRVDDCEDDPLTAFRVNALGARNIAVAAQELGSKLVHVSTDYVFGGEQRTQATSFTEFDTPSPINVYGKSKLAGEDFVRHLCHKHFIIRGSGFFGMAGSSSKNGNFVETIIRLAQDRSALRVVNDQVVSPTYTKDLAAKICELIPSEYYGIFHITNSGACSWYEFAKEIIRAAGIPATVTPIRSQEYPQKARRPACSVLDHLHLRLLGMDDMRSWQEALGEYVAERRHSQYHLRRNDL